MTETKKTAKKVVKPTSTNLPAGKAGAMVAKESPKNEGVFAIIETGGKQYRVSVGDTIKIEKIKGAYKEGDSLIFNKVLLIDNGAGVTDIGIPYIEGAKVSGVLAEIGRNTKVTVIKYKQKSRYFKKNGHHQPYFKVKIEKIS